MDFDSACQYCERRLEVLMAHSKSQAGLSGYWKVATHPQIFCLSKLIFRIMVVLGLVALGAAQDNPGRRIEDEQPGSVVQLPGLQAAARVVRDTNDITHVKAGN